MAADEGGIKKNEAHFSFHLHLRKLCPAPKAISCSNRHLITPSEISMLICSDVSVIQKVYRKVELKDNFGARNYNSCI